MHQIIGELQGVTMDQYGRKHGGDVLVGVDGDNIREFEQLVSYLEANTIPGDKIVLDVIRNGTDVELNAIMGETSADFLNSGRGISLGFRRRLLLLQ